jgi:DegV family protein with EDD domain
MRQSVLDAKWMADNGASAKEIKEALEKNAYNSVIFLAVDDLKYLKRGGRITPAAATLGTVLNIKPILTTTGEKFDAIEKVRGMKKSVAKLLDYTEEFANKMLEENDVAKIRIGAAGTFAEKADADDWYRQVKERFSDISDIYYDPLSFSVCCHTGPEAVGIGVSVILRDK